MGVGGGGGVGNQDICNRNWLVEMNLYPRYQLEATENVTYILELSQPYTQHFTKLASAYIKVH